MNRTILVIEQDENIQEIVAIILADQGFTVKLIKPSKGALKTIQEVKPCAILLDIIQVTEDGTELCRMIRETEELKQIPIIVLSTHPHAETVKDVCADEVVLKPFNIDELIAAVEKQLVE